MVTRFIECNKKIVPMKLLMNQSNINYYSNQLPAKIVFFSF